MNPNNNFMGFNNTNWNNEFTNKPMMGQNPNMMGVNPLMGGLNMQMQNMPMNMQYQMQMQNMPNFQGMNNMQMNNQPQNMSFTINQGNTINTSTNSFQGHNSINEEEKKSSAMLNGKYTCRFEIQIENDKDFQVARRLIGSKVYYHNSGM